MHDIYNAMGENLHPKWEDSMGRSAADTAQKHEEILDQSIRLFREKGFRSVSVGEVMKAAGLTHGPFYNHFASKEALMSESFSRQLQNYVSEFERIPSTEAGKMALLNRYLSEEHLHDCAGGCAVAALAAEVRQEPEVRGTFTVQLKSLIQKLTTHFPWKSRRSARGDAIHWEAAMVGAIILARAVDDEDFAREIIEETRKRLA